ncbi:hypothetical protein CBL_20502 [Carabus blaptoides fortunei]
MGRASQMRRRAYRTRGSPTRRHVTRWISTLLPQLRLKPPPSNQQPFAYCGPDCYGRDIPPYPSWTVCSAKSSRSMAEWPSSPTHVHVLVCSHHLSEFPDSSQHCAGSKECVRNTLIRT